MLGDEKTLNIEGHPLRNPFWRELDEGLITFRDNLQFELKSEFFINPKLKKNIYKQEVYIFIPETLQITSQTYSMKQYYLDQTNLIRYKTPFMTLEDLVDPTNKRSPLVRLQNYSDKDRILRELMLLGNIFRSTLRVRIRRLIKELERSQDEPPTPSIAIQAESLCREIRHVRAQFKKTKDFLNDRFEPNHFDKQVNYVDEFMSEVINEFLTLFLNILRERYHHNYPEADQNIYNLIIEEAEYRKTNGYGVQGDHNGEYKLYRQGLLEKFMLSVLKLRNTRVQTREKHAQLIASVAAGFAMFVYTILFVWKATTYVTNSAPFVFLAVLLYILKDRLKEGVKTLYLKKASLWFPDFSTEIQSPNGGEIIGQLNESFDFLSKNKIPKEFLELRYKNDKDELPAYQPDETVIQYKKEVTLYQQQSRLSELNTIFRYNIHRYLEKANDAIQPSLTIDPETGELSQHLLPKVYHINLILKNTFQDRKLKQCTEIKKFLVVIDKEGIRRVEHVLSQFQREDMDTK